MFRHAFCKQGSRDYAQVACAGCGLDLRAAFMFFCSICWKAVKDNCLFLLRASFLCFLSHRSDPMDVTGTISKVDVAVATHVYVRDSNKFGYSSTLGKAKVQ